MIGYYVHHHGRGHLHRALAITHQLDEPVTFLSSLPAPAGLRATDTWVRLPLDVPDTAAPTIDPAAHGRLHWVPTGVAGLAERHAIITDFLARERPRRVVVDVSVEVTLLVRLSGVPVVVMAMPGDRGDAVHRLALDVAEHVVAPWSDRVYRPDWLAEHEPRTHYVGSISRFDGRPRPARRRGARRCGVLLAGAGGSAVPAGALAELRGAAADVDWTAMGGDAAWVDDPWSLLAAADVVVCHAGQNAIADVAVAGVPAVVVPQDRPFDEQHATADALAAAGVAVAVPQWPAPERWPALIARARACGNRWDELRTRGAAARAAEVIAA